jgi:transposase
MLTVETIRKVRLSVHRDGKSIRQTARELNLARNTVRKVIRTQKTAFEYKRESQPLPKLGPYVVLLEERLSQDQKLPKRYRRSAQLLYEELQGEGYEGGYDSVRRFVKRWKGEHRGVKGEVFIPLVFEPGEAFQFDWSHEWVEMEGMPVKVKVAHIRLCFSRLFLAVAYPRETQEMVFDAHIRAFEFFGGTCRKGIYDNLKTAVNKILAGKERNFNDRFSQLCSHYLYEPVACSPAAGWEKGQVENQVKTVRQRLFTPRQKVKDFAELNAFLLSQCIGWAKTHKHPTIPAQTVWEVFEEERGHLINSQMPFDGYAERPARVSPSSLVTFDRNRYSVHCSQVGRTVQVRVYANRIVIVRDGELVGDHPRQFGRGKTVFDPWHYLPILERKPGALRNGAPFKEWDLPDPLSKVRHRLQHAFTDWDRQFVGILNAIPLYGLDEVAEACSQALTMRAVSKEVVLNLLHRNLDEGSSLHMAPPGYLILREEPVADCRRYDRLLKEGSHAPQ